MSRQEEILDGLYDATLDGEDEEVIQLTNEALELDMNPLTILFEALIPSLEEVGRLFEDGEYFVPEMLVAANAMAGAMDILKPLIAETGAKPVGTFVMGTVKGDIHDIGKNIVAILLKGSGYEVHDLGTDVDTEEISEFIKKESPDFLGLSALLTTTMTEMGVVMEALKDNGLRDKVKVFIGGAAVSDEYAQEIGADTYCLDGFQAIRVLDSFQKVKV